MSGFLAINRKISEKANCYIMNRNVDEITHASSAGSIGCGIVILLAFSLSGLFIITIPLMALLLYPFTLKPLVTAKKLEKNQKENLIFLQLLKTGVLTYCDLKYVSSKNDTKHHVSSKNDTKHPDRTNMRYFYELRYYDLLEQVHVFKFALRNLLKEKKLKNIPIIFSPENPKKAVVFNASFMAWKMAKKGLLDAEKLVITQSGEISIA